MDRILRILEDRTSRLTTAADCLRDLSATLEQYDYLPWPEDLQAMKDCKSDERKLPMAELGVGALGGFLLGSFVKQRIGATVLGMFLCYKARDPVPSAERCLHRMLCLPTPLGAELKEIMRCRHANHPLLNQLPARVHSPGRIARPEKQKEAGTFRDGSTQSVAIVVAELLTWGRQEAVQLAALLDVLHDGGEDVTMTMTPCELPVGDDLWRLSDPFGICFHQFADVSGPNAVKDAARSSKAQEHEQQPQEKCKEHQEAQISDDP